MAAQDSTPTITHRLDGTELAEPIKLKLKVTTCTMAEQMAIDREEREAKNVARVREREKRAGRPAPGDYRPHPAADAFPLMDGAAFQSLVADIKANGLQRPIELLGNDIIDGRNRLRACEMAGVTPRFRSVMTNDPIGYVVSANIARRHLTTAQRAAVAAELATLREGRPQKTGSNDPVSEVSIPQAAALLSVGTASVKRAKRVLREDPERHEAAKAGQKPPPKPRAPKTAKPKPGASPRPFELVMSEGEYKLLLAFTSPGADPSEAERAKAHAIMLRLGETPGIQMH
jgi:hypothetical protein